MTNKTKNALCPVRLNLAVSRTLDGLRDLDEQDQRAMSLAELQRARLSLILDMYVLGALRERLLSALDVVEELVGPAGRWG